MNNAWLMQVLQWLTYLFVLALGMTILAVAVLYVVDKTQKTHAIRRNYPVIGRFRYWFEHLGTFFRQYFFAMDREELPFNREQRNWAYRSAKNTGSTVAFGSTKDINRRGTVTFLNAAFPVMRKDMVESPPMIIGPYARKPYAAPSFFNVSGMSFGALSASAVRALSRGAARAGVWLNTGEGGLSPYHLEGGCDLVFQIGTAKYGVRTADGQLDEDRLRDIARTPQVKMIEIKLAQGAKPGKGGILPADKVTEEIARIRGIPPYQDSISPNRHPEIGNPGQLLDFIHRVRTISGVPVGFKMVMGTSDWLHDLFEQVHQRGLESAPDFITLDGGEGGSGAAPMPLMDDVGVSIREALPVLVDIRDQHGLTERVRIIASGKLILPGDVAWALAVGADFINNARGFMFSLGCIQAMRCHKNTCPTGVTTHDPDLQRGLVVADKSVRVANFARNMIHGVGTIAHSCGVPEPRQLTREHVRVLYSNQISEPLSRIFPPVRHHEHESTSCD